MLRISINWSWVNTRSIRLVKVEALPLTQLLDSVRSQWPVHTQHCHLGPALLFFLHFLKKSLKSCPFYGPNGEAPDMCWEPQNFLLHSLPSGLRGYPLTQPIGTSLPLVSLTTTLARSWSWFLIWASLSLSPITPIYDIQQPLWNHQDLPSSKGQEEQSGHSAKVEPEQRRITDLRHINDSCIWGLQTRVMGQKQSSVHYPNYWARLDE